MVSSLKNNTIAKRKITVDIIIYPLIIASTVALEAHRKELKAEITPDPIVAPSQQNQESIKQNSSNPIFVFQEILLDYAEAIQQAIDENQSSNSTKKLTEKVLAQFNIFQRIYLYSYNVVTKKPKFFRKKLAEQLEFSREVAAVMDARSQKKYISSESAKKFTELYKRLIVLNASLTLEQNSAKL